MPFTQSMNYTQSEPKLHFLKEIYVRFPPWKIITVCFSKSNHTEKTENPPQSPHPQGKLLIAYPPQAYFLYPFTQPTHIFKTKKMKSRDNSRGWEHVFSTLHFPRGTTITVTPTEEGGKWWMSGGHGSTLLDFGGGGAIKGLVTTCLLASLPQKPAIFEPTTFDECNFSLGGLWPGHALPHHTLQKHFQR